MLLQLKFEKHHLTDPALDSLLLLLCATNVFYDAHKGALYQSALQIKSRMFISCALLKSILKVLPCSYSDPFIMLHLRIL